MWLGLLLGIVLLIHGAGLYGLHEAETRQSMTEAKLKASLTDMSKEQGARIAETSQREAAGRSQKERLAMDRRAKEAQGTIALGAQGQLAKEITARDKKIKGTSIFPEWYLNGPMYGVIFILALSIMSFVWSQMLNKHDIDADFDGVPDHHQVRKRADANSDSEFPKEIDANGNGAENRRPNV